jgi:pyridoxamine 5'-phosphate oxidase family protein
MADIWDASSMFTKLDTIDIGGHDFARRKKYQDVQRNPRVAFLVDDLESVNPWLPAGCSVS